LCAVKAAILAIELAVIPPHSFFGSLILFFIYLIVVVVVAVLPFLLLDTFVSFDGLTFKDELGLCSEVGTYTHLGQTSSSKLQGAII
jgi:hypothetical protein